MRILVRLLRRLGIGIAAGSVCIAAAAAEVPVGYVAWDVTDPGTAGQFDIVNQTGPNGSGDATWPVTSALAFSSLSLVVSFSDGTSSTFGSGYFNPSPDGLSFDGTPMAIGAGAARPTGAVLTGLISPPDAKLFDGQIDHWLPTFTAGIASRSGGLLDGDLAIIDATTAPVTSVPEPDASWLFAAGLLALAARTARERRRRKAASRCNGAPAFRPTRASVIAAAALGMAAPSFAAVKLNSWTAPSKAVAGQTRVNLTATGLSLQPNELPTSVIVSFADSCGAPTVASAPATSVTSIIATSLRIQVAVPAALVARTYAASVSGTTSAGAFASGNCSLVNVAAPVDDWHTLIGRSWTLAAQSEAYVCRTIVAPSDMYISALRAESAAYFAIVTVGDALNSPPTVGDFACSPGSLFRQGVFMAGPGTGALAMPPGVAMHVRPGQYLSLNLHIVNDTDHDQSATTVIQARTADPATITADAELALTGTFLINLPSDGVRHTAAGSCLSSTSERVFALQPHLQGTGVHASFTRTRNGQDVVLLDTDYSIAAQSITPVASALQNLEAGDRLTAVCSYVNTTGHTMTFGESASNEQCFVGMYRTPPHVPTDPTIPSIFACAEGVAN